MSHEPNSTEPSVLSALREALESGTMRTARRMVAGLRPGEIARLLESLPVAERRLVWELVDRDSEGEVLVELADDVRDSLIQAMDVEQLVAATEGMAVDDLADLVVDLPEAITQQVIRSMDGQDRQRLREVLAYPEDSAGGLMDTDTTTVRPDVTVEVVLRYLRAHSALPDRTDSLIVVDRDDLYAGVLPITSLLVADPATLVEDLMDSDAPGVHAMTGSADVVRLFEDRDLLSVAVTGDDNTLLGRITVDDVVDVIRDEAEHSLMGAAGLDEDHDLFAPVFQGARRRAFWLGINLLTAFVAASVVDVFQTTIDKVVLLAVLMPIVPSMGGVAGTQSLTIITRAIALGQIEAGNAMTVLRREFTIGLINGLFWAILVAIVTAIWFKTWMIGLLVAVALACNLVIAALCGFFIPMILKRINVDPALAGGVILTTITDVIGYGLFLGLGAMFLL
ncbi:MAG: magnesium transporter [Pseudomonadota bacterium]